jgi:hypothetical protein
VYFYVRGLGKIAGVLTKMRSYGITILPRPQGSEGHKLHKLHKNLMNLVYFKNISYIRI